MRLVGEEVDPARHKQRVSTLPRASPLLERGAVARDRARHVWSAPRRACHAGAVRAQGRLRAQQPWGPAAGPQAVAWQTLPASCAASSVMEPPPRPQPQRQPSGPRRAGPRVTGSGPVTPRQFAGPLRAPSPEATLLVRP